MQMNIFFTSPLDRRRRKKTHTHTYIENCSPSWMMGRIFFRQNMKKLLKTRVHRTQKICNIALKIPSKLQISEKDESTVSRLVICFTFASPTTAFDRRTNVVFFSSTSAVNHGALFPVAKSKTTTKAKHLKHRP